MSDVTLHHVEYGDGTPLLALHGFTPDHRLMTGCLEPLFTDRPGYRRIYPDLPGMGRTPAGSVACADDMLAAVETFIDGHLGGAPFLLVGESYGGYLARAVAHARPAQVLGLALVCPAGTVIARPERTLPAHTPLVQDPAALALLDPDDAAEYVANTVVQTPETARRFTAEVMSGVRIADQSALTRISQQYALSKPPEEGTPYPGPTLILTGRQDSVTGYADVYPLLDHYPRASFAVLDRCGHNLQIEQPELFGHLINEWLDRVSEATGAGTH